MTTDEPGGGLQVAFAAILGVAVIGFFVGTGSGPDIGNPLVQHEESTAAEHVEPVPTYTSLRSRAASGEDRWAAEREALARGEDAPALAGRSAAVTDRAASRAYDGAPPTIPHPVRQNAAAECMACHEDGLTVRGKSASAMPHDDLASCTQCHVVESPPMPGAMLPPDATFAVNSFKGLASPGPGPRAWSIAPPMTPHKTTMRERCDSCHGPNGRDPITTPHPERQSCEQCHAPSADANQMPFGGVR